MQIPTISYFFFIGSGVLLKNVLKDMFPTECDDKSNTWHVIFEGADDYETSTPLSHILGEENDCLLATKMNIFLGEILFSVRTRKVLLEIDSDLL